MGRRDAGQIRIGRYWSRPAPLGAVVNLLTDHHRGHRLGQIRLLPFLAWVRAVAQYCLPEIVATFRRQRHARPVSGWRSGHVCQHGSGPDTFVAPSGWCACGLLGTKVNTSFSFRNVTSLLEIWPEGVHDLKPIESMMGDSAYLNGHRQASDLVFVFANEVFGFFAKLHNIVVNQNVARPMQLQKTPCSTLVSRCVGNQSLRLKHALSRKSSKKRNCDEPRDGCTFTFRHCNKLGIGHQKFSGAAFCTTDVRNSKTIMFSNHDLARLVACFHIFLKLPLLTCERRSAYKWTAQGLPRDQSSMRSHDPSD